MEQVHAKTSNRLLQKASRLFTGSLQGRMIELLQNARRAGATHVEINNANGQVVVRDNGSGIDDFSKLLELGNSNWDHALEQAEDPAGVGLFCLAPRQVTVRSHGKKMVITSNGWTGDPVDIDEDEMITGTELTFADERWELNTVEKHAIFSGMYVSVDGKKCHKRSFCSNRAMHYPRLGCRIEICPSHKLSQYHRAWQKGYYHDYLLMNFHGQVIASNFQPVSCDLVALVELTGEPTGIRLMLPARTTLFENDALAELKEAIEIEMFRYLQQQGEHTLSYQEYLRAKELGIDLPEAKETFEVGTLFGDSPEPVEVFLPDDFPLAKCYRVNPKLEKASESHVANIHLLAALGTFNFPFVPVTIKASYEGYCWAKLPTVDKVVVKAGKELGKCDNFSGDWIAVESLEITVHTSDGNIFTAKVCMAIVPPGSSDSENWGEDVYLTTQAQKQIAASDIWFHQSGYSDEGDTYDTQLGYFEKELDLFWSNILGPGPYLRQQILESLFGLKIDWQRIIVDVDKTVTLQMKDGSEKVLK